MKTLSGTVVSTKMEKTIVVAVIDRWRHPLYKKVVKRSKKYLADDPQGKAKLGDLVSIKPSRPISKNKCWALDQIIEAGVKE